MNSYNITSSSINCIGYTCTPVCSALIWCQSSAEIRCKFLDETNIKYSTLPYVVNVVAYVSLAAATLLTIRGHWFGHNRNLKFSADKHNFTSSNHVGNTSRLVCGAFESDTLQRFIVIAWWDQYKILNFSCAECKFVADKHNFTLSNHVGNTSRLVRGAFEPDTLQRSIIIAWWDQYKILNFFSCDECCWPSGARICAQLKPGICDYGIFWIAGGIFPNRSLKYFQTRLPYTK